MNSRKTIRLKEYNYSQNGVYFITICTDCKKHIFGKIKNYKMNLNSYGLIANKHILLLQEIYDDIFLDKYVIMPNHIHILLMINNENTVHKRNENRTKERLPKIIQSLKSTITKDIRKYKKRDLNKTFPTIWQRSYYEHIIRGTRDWQTAWEYIENNPLKWELDKYYIKERG